MAFRDSHDPHTPDRASAAEANPTMCPVCQSPAIVTGAKPDANSYWRCTRCGNMWHGARSRAAIPPPRRW